jgi:hypothetical protein
MSDIADAAELLETARETLLSAVLPELGRDRRYDALMIANVLATAARDYRLGTAARSDEARRLRQQLTDAGIQQATETLAELRKAMRSAIRAGAFDDPARGRALARDLLHTACEQVGISNPKAIRAGDDFPGANSTMAQSARENRL